MTPGRAWVAGESLVARCWTRSIASTAGSTARHERRAWSATSRHGSGDAFAARTAGTAPAPVGGLCHHADLRPGQRRVALRPAAATSPRCTGGRRWTRGRQAVGNRPVQLAGGAAPGGTVAGRRELAGAGRRRAAWAASASRCRSSSPVWPSKERCLTAGKIGTLAGSTISAATGLVLLLAFLPVASPVAGQVLATARRGL